MAVYKCMLCGCVFDEEKEGRKFSELNACPMCGADVSLMELQETELTDTPTPEVPASPNKARYMSEIHEMSETGRSISGAMGTQMPMPS